MKKYLMMKSMLLTLSGGLKPLKLSLSPFHSMNLSYALIPITISFFCIISLKLKKESLILMISMLNLMGLIPEFWCVTSYLWGNIFVGIFTWSLYSMNKVFHDFKFWSAHLLPLGAPIFLWSFLVLLELTSQLIRPITLSLRLTCNLMAGHVLMALIMVVKFGLLLLLMILFFELCVSIIQAVVFNLLINSYKTE